jgi:ribosomal protein L22
VTAEEEKDVSASEESRAAEKPVAAKAEGKAEAKKAAKKPAAKKEAAKKEPAAKKEAAAKAEGKAPAKKPAAKKAAKEPAAKAKETKEAAKETEAKPARARKQAPAATRRRVVRAQARYVRTSARKARMVCGHLRGKSVQEARAILAFTPRGVARDWSKLLESAVANAESNHELLEDDLIVREAYADEGPTIKRFRPRAMGRATPIRKRTSHLTITLTARPDGSDNRNG